LFVAFPTVTVPLRAYGFVNVRAAVESLEKVTPFTAVNNPVPNAALLPANAVPAMMRSPPVKEFGPERSSVPRPAFARLPAP
jgi:hypothetical protein